MNFSERPLRKPTNEQTPGELFITKLGLHPGVRIKLIKISTQQESRIASGDSLEGVLDKDVVIGQPIYLDGSTKNTSELIGVKEENDRIYFKTRTSVYELVPPTIASSPKPKSKELITMEESILKALKEAQDIALTSEEMQFLFKKRLHLQRIEQTQDILAEINKIDEEVKKHKISVETLPEFQFLMKNLGKNYYRVTSTITHENAHGNKADAIGAKHEGYSLLVSKSKKGEGFSYQPMVHTTVPRIWDKEKQIKANIKIAQAPDEYGDHISDGDEEQIKKLREELKNL